jgi:hypothetical protein
MIIIHAVQKLLNISRLKPTLYVSDPAPQQELHSWYAKLISTSFKGKLMVMYVHQPSLIIVLTKGKTITGTLQEFYLRLESLLRRNNFEPEFIKREIELMKEGYVISKTNSKSVLASMNAITQNIEYRCSTFLSYESINVNSIEDAFMEWLVYDPSKPYGLRRTSDYWREKRVTK